MEVLIKTNGSTFEGEIYQSLGELYTRQPICGASEETPTGYVTGIPDLLDQLDEVVITRVNPGWSEDQRTGFVQEGEEEFERCSDCDGHDACADFGCAIQMGLGHLVNTELS